MEQAIWWVCIRGIFTFQAGCESCCCVFDWYIPHLCLAAATLVTRPWLPRQDGRSQATIPPKELGHGIPVWTFRIARTIFRPRTGCIKQSLSRSIPQSEPERKISSPVLCCCYGNSLGRGARTLIRLSGPASIPIHPGLIMSVSLSTCPGHPATQPGWPWQVRLGKASRRSISCIQHSPGVVPPCAFLRPLSEKTAGPASRSRLAFRKAWGGARQRHQRSVIFALFPSQMGTPSIVDDP